MMPTLFDYLLTSKNQLNFFFDGTSLFCPQDYPYALSARFNAGQEPYEFFITDGKEKTIFAFVNKFDIFKSKQLEIFERSPKKAKNFEMALLRYFKKRPLSKRF